MLVREIDNPRGAGRVVADYQLFKDDGGFELELPRIVVTCFTASAAVARGDVLVWTHTAAAATPLRVATSGTSAVGYRVIGVAIQAAAAGAICPFVSWGFCFVNVGSGTAAAGSYGAPSATAGQLTVATTPDATIIAGTIVGEYLGAKDSANLAPFWLTHV